MQLGHKGRVVLPVAVRRAAHIPEHAHVVAHAAGEGRIVIETTDAIRTRVWAAASPENPKDATAGIRAMRQEDNAIADSAAETRRSQTGSAEAGAALLQHLGL